METSKWVLYKNGRMWYTECGHTQGIKVRPKQKTCFFRKRIERIKVADLSLADKEFMNIVNMYR